MCNCDTSDGPSCFRQIRRRARKEHTCVECRKHISPGEEYEYTSGVWDGYPDDFKTCLKCVILREAHIKAEENLQLDDRNRGPAYMRTWPVERCAPTIGEIIQTIGECARDDSRYIRFFRDARKSLLEKRM